MKYITSALLLCLMSIPAFSQKAPLRAMTFNIRYDTPRDSANAWPRRIEKVTSLIRFHEPQIVGLQEALHHQLEDIAKALPQYKYLGVGRDDGQQKGEYSAILYDASRLTLLDQHTFWLSETPEKPGSKGWDADICRIVTYARFRDNATKKEFYHFNTHFDHRGPNARKESARLLLSKVDAIAGKTLAVITGDFNAQPQDEPIRIITDASNPLHLQDTRALSATPPYGPTGTFNGFKAYEQVQQPIDFIFVKGPWKVLRHGVISESWKGLYASDHYPVVADLQR
ncbi:endonuclease/exonuclease/phosphatase family protein [Chitinophaga lutea]